MASYNDYLRELGHTAENVVTEKINPIKNKIKSLQDDIEKQKRENNELSIKLK